MSYTPLSVGSPAPAGTSKWDTHDTAFIRAGDSVMDALQQIVAQDQCILFPPAVNFFEDVGAANPLVASFDTFVFPYWYLINEDLTTDITPIAWKETGSALGNYELPFRQLKLGFNLGELVTQVHTTTRTAAQSYTASNTTTSATYGTRSQVLNNYSGQSTTNVAFSEKGVDPDTNVVYSLNANYYRQYADRTLEWFDRTVFGPVSWEISGGMIYNEVTDTTSVQKILETPYLQQGGLFRVMTMEATGAGGATLDFRPTAMKMSLSIGANDWVMRFDDAIPGSTAFGFILDDNALGILDENRV